MYKTTQVKQLHEGLIK